MPHKYTKQLHISFTRDETGCSTWKAQMTCGKHQPVGGALRSQSALIPARLQALKRRYDQHIRTQRELAGRGIPVPPLNERPLIALGREIAGLLPEPLLHKLRLTLQSIRQRRQFLRVTLEFEPGAVELVCLPWELLALPADEAQPIQSEAESFVFLQAGVALVRQIRQVGRTAPARLRRPLAARGFCASPRQVERIEIRSTLAAGSLQTPSDPKLDWYTGPDTLGALQQRLRDGDAQIVHLLCHGEQCDNGQFLSQHLVLSDADGNPQRVAAATLVRMLSLAPDLRLVLLQACHAGSAELVPASEAQRSAVTGIALELLRAGVPAVIAMQGEVGQSAADHFVRSCYDTLRQGGTIEQAVAVGRLAMYAADGIVDWSLPILYQGSRQAA